ncbi:MAG: CDP-alcohol phosphatidyltransferase family protein, partial [Bryobacteraceae bacterium]
MFRKLPNLITAARLVLAPIVFWLILGHRYHEALALVVLAGITDALDGFAARRFGAVTRSGAYLDPIADKALLCCLYVAFGFSGDVPWWLVAVVFGRDLFILGQVAAAMILTTIRDFR